MISQYEVSVLFRPVLIMPNDPAGLPMLDEYREVALPPVVKLHPSTVLRKLYVLLAVDINSLEFCHAKYRICGLVY